MKISIKILFVFLSIANLITSQPKFSRLYSAPGAFSRGGFSPRGTAMGDALAALIDQRVEAIYNPSLGVFQNTNYAAFGKAFLAFDRYSNYFFFGRNFKFKKIDEKDNFRSAGFYAGILNCGVSNIDIRDNDGFKIKSYSTSENLIFVSLSNRFSEKLSLGTTIRYYYYDLYEKITSEGVGFDIGATYIIKDNLIISFVLKDINSKYKWDSSPIYGIEGKNSIEKFPLFKIFAASYSAFNGSLKLAAQYENSNYDSNRLNFGVEYSISEFLFFRLGISSLDISNFDVPVKFSFGFGTFYTYQNYEGYVDYALYYDQYAENFQHLIGLSIKF